MSTYQIRSLSLGGVLDQAVAITKNHFGPLLTIVLVTFLPFQLAMNLVWSNMAPAPLSIQSTPQEHQAFWDAYSKMGRIFLVLWLPLVLTALICNAALIRSISEAYLGKSSTTGAAVKHAFKRILPIMGTGFLVGLTSTVGLMLCVVPGIIAMLWFILSTQVVVIEGISGISAMKHSKALMRGNMGAFFVLILVIGLLNILINGVNSLIPQPHLRAVTLTLIQAVMTVFASAAVVVFYFSARCKNEQFDLQQLADNIGDEVVLEADDDQRSVE